jgi:hypothetical protein
MKLSRLAGCPLGGLQLRQVKRDERGMIWCVTPQS